LSFRRQKTDSRRQNLSSVRHFAIFGKDGFFGKNGIKLMESAESVVISDFQRVL